MNSKFTSKLFKNGIFFMFISEVYLMASVLSEEVIDQLLSEEAADLPADCRSIGRPLFFAAELAVNSTIKAINAFSKRRFKSFDANPGDAGCQNRALILHELNREDPGNDFSDVLTIMQKTSKQIGMYYNSHNNDEIRSICIELRKLKISGELEFLVHSLISQTTKMIRGYTLEGMTLEASDISRFSIFSKKSDLMDRNLRFKILQQNQKVLSRISVAAMQAIAMRVHSLPAPESAAMKRMLAPENRRVVLSEYGSVRTFGFLFAEIKTLLARLKETQGVVCFRSIVPKGQKRFCIFLKSQGGEFDLIAPDGLSKDLPVVVFEAVVQENSQEHAEMAFGLHGFSTIILAQAARERPFEAESKVEHAEMIQEIENAPQVGLDLFTVDHVFLASFDEVIQ